MSPASLALVLLLAAGACQAVTTCTILSGGLSATCSGVTYSIANMQPNQRQ